MMWMKIWWTILTHSESPSWKRTLVSYRYRTLSLNDTYFTQFYLTIYLLINQSVNLLIFTYLIIYNLFLLGLKRGQKTRQCGARFGNDCGATREKY